MLVMVLEEKIRLIIKKINTIKEMVERVWSSFDIALRSLTSAFSCRYYLFLEKENKWSDFYFSNCYNR